MSRYRVVGPDVPVWTTVSRAVIDTDKGTVVIEMQSADIIDNKTGDRFTEGAYRIIRNGKPRNGKGGTTPWFGELAFSYAKSAFDTAVFETRRES